MATPPLGRREFLAASFAAPAAIAGVAALDPLERALQEAGATAPEVLARDELFWSRYQEAFAIDRSIRLLNHGGTCPCPSRVLAELQRLEHQINTAPHRQIYHVLAPQLETVREGLAADLGAHPDEIAIVRNSTEALEICQWGLELAAGDEVVTTTHDYPSMRNTWEQRKQRHGIVVSYATFKPPATLDEIFDAVTAKITARTKVLHISHLTNLTGQLFPVRRLADFAHARGIEVIVDGAHAYAHLPFQIGELGCDYYATSLHKWLYAPVGTGMLWVRKEKLRKLWPLFGAPEPHAADARKLEHAGTGPIGAKLAIGEALRFHRALGVPRKLARLLALRERWFAPLRGHKNVILYTPEAPELASGLATVGIRGVDPIALADHLWKTKRIVTAPILIEDVRGLRITPNICSTLDEVDELGRELLAVADHGLPPTAEPSTR